MGQNKAQREAAKRAEQERAKAVEMAVNPKDGDASKIDGTGVLTAADTMDDATALCGGPALIAKVEAKHAKKAAKVAAKVAKPKPEPRPVCPSVKKDGSPCTARCAEGKDTCVDHQPAWDRLTHEEHVAFGQWLRKAKGPEIVEVIGWWKAKQIAKDQAGPVPTEQEQQVEG